MKDIPKQKSIKKLFKALGVVIGIFILLIIKDIICDFLGFQTSNNKLKYEKCLQQDIGIVHEKLAYNHNMTVEEIQRLIPDIILKEIAICVCDSYVYGNPFVSAKTKDRNCQQKVIDSNIGVLIDACEQHMKNTVKNEFEKQNLKFNEKDWKTKYQDSAREYCVCLVVAKSSILMAVEHHLLPEADIIKSLEEHDLKCVQKHLREFL